MAKRLTCKSCQPVSLAIIMALCTTCSLVKCTRARTVHNYVDITTIADLCTMMADVCLKSFAGSLRLETDTLFWSHHKLCKLAFSPMLFRCTEQHIFANNRSGCNRPCSWETGQLQNTAPLMVQKQIIVRNETKIYFWSVMCV